MTSPYSFRKTGTDEYEVSRDGVVIGRIHKAWARNGGWGWVDSEKAGSGTERTRDGAARRIYRRWRQLQTFREAK